ncbi:DegV domain-containing protein [Deinococcus malanensis]|uniref:DegV domain-containing protein n=1 Tax=Deinococcus malanensis TaxID=1706855 RepID=A0ABQ2EYD0_9DEIO|nr:DegV family protein [Deinococcus malanensis]GGK32746.1 DegV domain-containing protein [Deinococcus malanensis]
MTHSPFSVITDGGLDAFSSLQNAVPVAPFALNFGSTTFRMDEITREGLYEQLRTNPVHPTSSQPTPQDWVTAAQQSGAKQVLAVTISAGLSGSRNAAEQARSMNPELTWHIHDSGTLSAAQAFQVHAASTAAQRSESVETALAWMQTVHQETELYFTIETLEYLRRGGRIGRVQATLGGLLNLKPVITVDKSTGQYTNVGRARTYRSAIDAVAAQVTQKYGEGAPLRLGLLYGSVREDADTALEILRGRHPIIRSDFAPVNPVLNIHTGPRALGIAAAAGAWPWER